MKPITDQIDEIFVEEFNRLTPLQRRDTGGKLWIALYNESKEIMKGSTNAN